MKADIIKKLEELDLSRNEAKVYSSLLEIGQTSAGNIIKKTRLHRSVVYETLDKLKARKFVFEVKKKRISYFKTTAPSKLLEYAKAKQRIAENLLPQLKEMTEDGLPEINIYEGIEAYRSFWIDVINTLPIGSTVYIAGSISEKWNELLGKDLEEFSTTRIKRKIKWKMIVFEKNPSELVFAQNNPELNEFRLVNKDINKFGNFNVYGKDILLLHSATEPMVIEIKNKTLFGVFKNIFDILWESGKMI
jgi:sugar-specific transcriptional regulator TrmB